MVFCSVFGQCKALCPCSGLRWCVRGCTSQAVSFTTSSPSSPHLFRRDRISCHTLFWYHMVDHIALPEASTSFTVPICPLHPTLSQQKPTKTNPSTTNNKDAVHRHPPPCTRAATRYGQGLYSVPQGRRGGDDCRPGPERRGA